MPKPISVANKTLKLHSFQRIAAIDCGWNAFPTPVSSTAVPMIATNVLRINAPQNLSAVAFDSWSSMFGSSVIQIELLKILKPLSEYRRGGQRPARLYRFAAERFEKLKDKGILFPF